MLNQDWELQLQQLRAELILMKESIKETSVDIIKEGYSSYPIFIAHQHAIEIGNVILDKEDMATHWSISASTLEEFLEKKLVQKEKEDFFKQNYKNAAENICLFVIYQTEARFVFIPYKTAANEAN